MQIPVTKYHGCGNDFILITDPTLCAWQEEEMSALAKAVCDRHLGIGADGCIFVPATPLEMVYFNQDGSRADMCGNGIRCLAACVLDQKLVDAAPFDVKTRAGVRTVSVIEPEKENGQRLFQIRMGKPDFDPEKIGVHKKKPIENYPLHAGGGTVPVNSFYMNTIHTVVFVDDDPFDPNWEQLGEEIGTSPFYPEQTNVNFVEVLDDSHLKAATWERGCGMTLSCGTGMCASAVMANKLGMTGPSVDVEMKKGSLHIDIEGDGTVILTGPAQKIMEGNYEYDKKISA